METTVHTSMVCITFCRACPSTHTHCVHPLCPAPTCTPRPPARMPMFLPSAVCPTPMPIRVCPHSEKCPTLHHARSPAHNSQAASYTRPRMTPTIPPLQLAPSTPAYPSLCPFLPHLVLCAFIVVTYTVNYFFFFSPSSSLRASLPASVRPSVSPCLSACLPASLPLSLPPSDDDARQIT